MSCDDDIFEINMIYDINDTNIIIFGSDFVKNNKNICKIIIDNKEYELMEQFTIKNNVNNLLKIKLKGIDKFTSLDGMFRGCSSLLSLPDISKWNTNNIVDMSSMFYGCSSLSSLPDISK